MSTKHLSDNEKQEFILALQSRFEKNMKRHKNMNWELILKKLETQPAELSSLFEMELTGGEPDVVGYDQAEDKYLFVDCSAESPAGRRNLCYDRVALDSRKEFKPQNSAVDMAAEMGVELLSETQYRMLQELGSFDAKTSSWVKTPPDIRKRGGALFADYRYGSVFIYHNGASSYFSARGFRAALKI